MVVDTPFWAALQTALRDGLPYAGCSAGVAFLTEKTFDSDRQDFDSVWAPGIGYVKDTLFGPHWDIVDTWIPGATDFIAGSVGPGQTFIGLDEETAMVGDGHAWEVMGRAKVHVLRGEEWTLLCRRRRVRAPVAPRGRSGMTARGSAAGLGRDAPIEQRAPEIIRILSEAYPDAKVALRFSNPLEMLVATILSAQCTDEKVNEVTATLFVKYRTAEDYLKVPEDELKADIKPTGFFNQKAISIREACRRIVEVYDGRVPDTMEDLITLRGVARKTANIVMGNAFGKVEGIAVDTHVKRLANRLGFSEQSDPDKIEQDLMRVIPRDRWFDFTYVLIDHGRATCVARKPRCEECPVNHLCPSSLV